MAKKENIITAYQKAYLVVYCWFFTHQIKEAIIRNLIKIDVFDIPVDLTEGGKRVGIIHPKSHEHIHETADNLEGITMGTVFITFNEAFSDSYGDLPVNISSDLDSLRVIIYMFRCAFAHNPTQPKWEIRNPKYRRILTIKEIDFKVDLRELNGKNVTTEECGGFQQLLRLIEYCLKVIKNEEEKHEDWQLDGRQED